MRSLVSIFAAFLILISLYQLSFTWFVNNHEKAMEEKALRYVKTNYQTAEAKYPGNKEAQALYEDSLGDIKKERLQHLLDSTRDQKITWWGQSYQKAKESELLFGLDLQGGINVTMDVALDGLIRNLSNNPADPALKKAIEEAVHRKSTSATDFITLFAQVYKEQNPGQPLAPLFSNSTRNKLKANASDDATVSYIRDQASAAMKQTFQVLSKRIDKFGVAQPNINLDENKGIITVELAGATDPDRVRKYLQSTANLQFWEVYKLSEIANSVVAADEALATSLKGGKAVDSTAVKADTSATAAHDTTKSLSEQMKGGAQNTAAAAKTPEQLKLEHPLFASVQFLFPQKQGDKMDLAPYVAMVSVKDTSVANLYFNSPAVKNSLPADLKFLYGMAEKNKESGKVSEYLPVYAIKTVPGTTKAKLEGEVITDANQDYNPMSAGQVTVSMDMNKQGEKVWAKMTGDNVGRSIAIVLDDIVYSAPNVNEPITGGRSSISGNFTAAEGQDLANILKSGKLDAPAKIVQEQVVGPTLGKEAIKGGTMAFAISFVVIFALMLIYYNTAGWVANIALILNLLFTIGVLSALGATLTAPGIAGLVLTIGMAVDTNVIIFERIKEELTKGKNYHQAVKDGYRRSLPPVLDAHVTTLLTALILFYFGLGPVKGFATTQILGILLSLFCGILVSRLITDFYTQKQRHFNYFTNISRKVFKHAAYKFVEYRKVAYAISVVVLILGVTAVFNGFNEGVEFSGGRSYIVKFDKPVHADDVRNALDKEFGKFPLIKTYGDNSHLDITTDYLIHQEGLSTDTLVQNKLYEGLKPFLGNNVSHDDFVKKNLQGSKKVSPTISDDLKSGAKWATFWSLLIIAIYIFLRFRDWRFSLGTIFSLLHDVLVTLAVFSFFKNIVPFPLEIDQHFIAAILTVIGFSMNDTVIVFDRVRENAKNMRGATRGQIINKSINDTLSRTIMTSLTVFLTILILFLVGGEVTKGFAFAMLIGVITGTYSSIFVAAPILVDFGKNKPLGEADLVHHEPKTTAPAATTTAKS
ncbi:protein translocase subunit SecDF [Pinibacter aurantiacus]|uniref:Multifunctional fusion protein n=1 Tax=Pinibacter aurantiacus TaxID=2851599 RepID=A0A9E2S6C1_9BACT|nr:protein translocase subunit SecDF [Pinibacter aurantiacus]MBV4355762.1 protein translocase subunit SecDF [Pinibacter aurantiacus]